jgi:hypothetical protein
METERQPERQPVRSWITDSGIIIAMITVTFYFCALVQQKGYLNYFNIPIEYISLTPTIILDLSLQLIALVGGILIGLMLLCITIAALIISLKDRLIRLLEHSFGLSRPRDPSFASLDRFMIDAAIILVVFMAIMSLIAYARYTGNWNAEHRENFYLVKNFPGVPKDLVVFQLSGDYLVTLPLDRTTQKVERKIYLLKISDMGQTPIEHEQVGPLRVKR